MKRVVILILLSAVFHLNSFAQLKVEESSTFITLDELDGKLESMLEDWDLPGMAVAIVKDGEVVLSKGYGTTSYQGDQKIDEHTNFSIASLSKAFTAASIAILVDQGKLSWDDKVIEYLPWFQLSDPYITANLTIRDMLSHRAGYKTFSGDLLWFETAYDRDEILRRARYLEPAYGFREHFGYSNIMYIAAGQIIEEVSGVSWDEFVATRFFQPLGMERTHSSDVKRGRVKNVAMPHSTITGKPQTIEYMNWDNVAAAGGINSNVDDLTAWVKLWLNEGINGTDTFFHPRNLDEIWSVQTPLSVSAGSQRLWPSTHFSGYGLGWSLKDYKGVKLIGHSGGTDGMTTYLALVPEQDLGIVILTNTYSSLYYPVLYTILDKYLGWEGTDWGATFLNFSKYREQQEQERIEKDIEARKSDTKPSLELADFAGTYGGDLYGDAIVTVDGDALHLNFVPAANLSATLTHWHYDTFKLEFDKLESLPAGKVNFVINAEGKVEEMRVDVPNPDFDFTELEFKRKED